MNSRWRFKLGKRKKAILGVLILVLAIGVLYGLKKLNIIAQTTSTGPYCKYLISYDRNGGVSPTYLRDNLTRIEGMTDFPYNGVGILESISSYPMSSSSISYTSFYNALAPLRSAPTPKYLKHNFIRVLLSDPGDMFNDAAWHQTALNFTALGQAIRDTNAAGFPIDGILFDNEGPYGRPTCSAIDPGTGQHEKTKGYWNTPSDTDHAEPTHFLDHPDCWPYIRNWATHKTADYNTKAQERGRQMMQGLVDGWSNAKLMFMHSADVSCKNMDGIVRKNDVAWANEMLGPFAVGMAEAAYQTNAKVIDGGEESYGYIDQDRFTTSYNMRNTGMVTTYKSDCSFIPTAYQTQDSQGQYLWSGLFDIGFALYNKVYGLGGGQDATTIGGATTLALQNTENYVWFYTEDVNSIDPNASNYINKNPTNSDWMTPIKNGRKTVINDSACGTPGSPTPTPSITPTRTPTPTPTPTKTVTPTPTPTPTTGCEPLGPSDLVATAVSTTEINLIWKDNSSNENGFSIERSTSPTSGFSAVGNTYAPNVTAFSDKNLSSNTTYYYKVRGYNGCGSGVSPYSNTASATTKGGIPLAPSNLTSAATSTAINLSWSDNSINENGFSIERSSTSSIVGFGQIGWVTDNHTTYSDSTAQENVTYWYRVSAFNSNGNSPYSNVSENTIRPTPTTPYPPSYLTAKKVTTGIRLAWRDRSSNENGFTIERSTIGSTTGFSQIGWTNDNKTTYTDTTAKKGVKYWYRVAAFNGQGNSAYSNVVSIRR